MWCVRGLGFWSSVAVAAAVLSGCASSGHKAPVEDRGPSSRASSGAVPGQVVEAAPALPGAENAGEARLLHRQAGRCVDSYWPGKRPVVERLLRAGTTWKIPT